MLFSVNVDSKKLQISQEISLFSKSIFNILF